MFTGEMKRDPDTNDPSFQRFAWAGLSRLADTRREPLAEVLPRFRECRFVCLFAVYSDSPQSVNKTDTSWEPDSFAVNRGFSEPLNRL